MAKKYAELTESQLKRVIDVVDNHCDCMDGPKCDLTADEWDELTDLRAAVEELEKL